VFSVVLGTFRPAKRHVNLSNHCGQWRAEFVGGSSGKLALLLERLFQPRQHGITGFCKPANFVIWAAPSNPPTQIFRANALRHARNRINWRKRPVGKKQSAAAGEQHGKWNAIDVRECQADWRDPDNSEEITSNIEDLRPQLQEFYPIQNRGDYAEP
jgi:hypothetical protein